MKEKLPQGSQESREYRNLIQKEIENMPAVADQRGWLVTFVGIALSYLISSIFLGALSNEKIELLLREGLGHVDTTKVSLGFESAKLDLRDGLIPRFRVQIHGIRVESKDPCLFAPVFSSSLANLPLSWFRLLLGKNPVHEVQIVDAALRVSTNRSACGNRQTGNGESSGGTPSSSPAAAFSSFENFRQPAEAETGKGSEPKASAPQWTALRQSPLDSIKIERLGLFLNDEAEAFVEVEDLEFNVDLAPPRRVRLWSKVHLFKEQNIQDYFTHGVFSAEYSEDQTKKIQAEIRGHVREGNYALELSLLPETGDFDLKSTLDHVPFAPLLQLLRRFEILQTDFPAKKVWSTFKAESRGNLFSPEDIQLRIFPVEISGEIGNFTTREILIRNLSNPQVSPFVLTIKKLDLDQIADQVPRLRANFIQKYGVFEGALKFENLRQIQVSGLHRDMELIFSNLGKREVQHIRHIVLEGSYSNSGIEIQVPRIDFSDGLFQGNLFYSLSQSGKESLRIQADELTFATEVQEVMTMGGLVSPMNFVYSKKWSSLETESEDLRYTIPEVLAYGIRLENIRGEARYLNSGSNKKVYLMNTSVGSLRIDPRSPVAQYLAPLPLSRDLPQSLESLRFNFELESFQSVRWKNVSARSRNGQYLLDGGWDGNQVLFGQIQFISGSRRESWMIRGDRSSPQFLSKTRN